MPGHGLITGETHEEMCSIIQDDPLSATQVGSYCIRMQREEWSVRIECSSRLTCDAENYFLEAQVVAYEGDVNFNERKWSETIPRK